MAETPARAAAAPGRGWLLAALVAAAAGAALVAALHGDPYANPDSRSFVALAGSVARGTGLSYEDQGVPGFALKAFRPPLYPLLLGGLLALGLPLAAALPLQGALHGLTAVLLAWLAAQAAGRRAAWVAGAAGLAWWSAWLAAGQYMTETLYGALLVGALAVTVAAARRAGRGTALGAGLLAGASLLARATGLAAVAACALGLGARAPRLVAVLLLGVLLVWAPWVARNRVALGQWAWLGTSGGLNVWSGNTGAAIGAGWALMAEELPRRGEAGMEREFYARTRRWIAAHPGAWVRVVMGKVAGFLVPLDRSVEYLPYRLAFPFVLLGALLALRDTRWRLPLWAWLLHGAVGAVTVMSPRYRGPAELPALLLAVAGVEWTLARWGARRGGWACAGVVVLGLGAWALQGALRGGS